MDGRRVKADGQMEWGGREGGCTEKPRGRGRTFPRLERGWSSVESSLVGTCCLTHLCGHQDVGEQPPASPETSLEHP